MNRSGEPNMATSSLTDAESDLPFLRQISNFKQTRMSSGMMEGGVVGGARECSCTSGELLVS